MSLVCPSCGSEAPSTARFCPSCGTSLRPLGDERRIVTVLFADVVGFTSLAESRDPEQVKNLIDRCFEGLAADVTAFGGRVDKIIGDGMVALFGAPVAHEDDAERAVRAALRMQASVQRSASDQGMKMRIGVNTGEVLVGALRAGGDATVMGDVVNIASRLQSSALPGQVLVGPATYEATKDVVRYDELGPLRTRGREGEVVAYSAVEPLGPPGVRPRRARTPLIGRKAELGMLWHALGTAVGTKRPHLVLLLGEAGVGKTRLAEEVQELARVEHAALVLEGRCLPYGEANVWWPIAEPVKQLCGISASDDAVTAVDRCRSRVGELFADDGAVEASRVADGLLHLMGYEGPLHDVDPARARDEALRSLRACATAIARSRPLVFTLAELHWADDLVLGFLDRIMQQLRDVPLMIVATARPELEQRWAPRPGRYNMVVLNLPPLDRDSASRLLDTMLDRELSTDVRAVLIERSGGNPLFLEELAGLLVEQETVLKGSPSAEGAALPATLRGLLAARVDALDPSERSVLEDAAVGGRTGPLGALLAVGRDGAALQAALDSLMEKDLLLVEGDGYAFRSELVRDVAYETLTKAERARRHAQLGAWLEEHAREAGREDEEVERIAHHYGTAAELVEELGEVASVSSAIRDKALAWLGRAAARAQRRETPGVSIHLFEQALRLTGNEAPQARRRMLLGRARARTALRDLNGARADVTAVMEQATAEAHDEDYASALTLLGDIQRLEGNLEAGAATLERAVDLWRRLSQPRGEADALRLWGMTNLFRGDLEAAEEAISQAHGLFTRIGDRRGEAWGLQNLAWVSFYRGDHEIAEDRLNHAAEVFTELGDFGGYGWAMGLLGYVSYIKGDLVSAEAIAESGIEWTQEMGDRWARGMMLNLLAGVRIWQGRTEEGLSLARDSQELFRAMGDRFGIAYSSGSLAVALAMRGRMDEAETVSRRALEAAESLSGEMRSLRDMHAAWLASMRGEPAAAIEQVGEKEGSPGDAVQYELTLAIALCQIGQGHEALERLEPFRDAEFGEGPDARLLASIAFAAACAGSGQVALAAADELERSGTGTYADLMLAEIARGCALVRMGAAAAAAAFDKAVAIADGTGDLLAQALARLARAYGQRAADPAAEVQLDAVRSRARQAGVSGPGWDVAFGTATGEPAESLASGH